MQTPVTNSSSGPQSLTLESPPELFINRELSLVEFQRRVLHEAQDPKNPLLERLKFLSIGTSQIKSDCRVQTYGIICDSPRDRRISASSTHVAKEQRPGRQCVAASQETTKLDSTRLRGLLLAVLPCGQCLARNRSFSEIPLRRRDMFLYELRR
jgi:hypothetical protein